MSESTNLSTIIGVLVAIVAIGYFIFIVNEDVDNSQITGEAVVGDLDLEQGNNVQEIKSLAPERVEDNFDSTNETHWPKMPITFSFENECVERLKKLSRNAYATIENETDGYVSFEEVNSSGEIKIYCKPQQDGGNGDDTLADAQQIFDESNENLIIGGIINIYGQGQACNTGYPALEVHEILHLFDFIHNPKVNSIMSPYAAQSSNDCKITKIDKEYVDCLKYTYSNGQVGICDIQNFIISNQEEEYEMVCGEGYYPALNSDEWCCPDPDNYIDSEGYCSYTP